MAVYTGDFDDMTAQPSILTLSLTTMNVSDSVKENALGGCCPTSASLNSHYTPQDSLAYENGLSTETGQTLVSYDRVTIFLGVIETMIGLAAIVGNALVIASVYTNRKLRTITNLFVVSLAFADLMVGLLVLPFAIKVELTKSWNLGRVICEIFVTLDVLLCTASILNLCCISIDRYFAITRPLMCATKRSKRLAMSMIGAVWLLSLIITIPPLLGWKEDERRDGRKGRECGLIQQKSYVIYSALGSFYIPLAIMIFVYANIFVVARNAQRRWSNHSSRGASVPSWKPNSIPASPVAAHGSTISGVDKEGWSMGVGVRPRAVRVMSAGSDAVCCGCFGRAQWTGTYALRVSDDCNVPPGVVAESHNRQTMTGSDISRQSMRIDDAVTGGTRPCSLEHKSNPCSLDHDSRPCSTGHDGRQCSPRLDSQLSNLGSNARISTTGSELRQSSLDPETLLSGAGPNSSQLSTESDVRTGLPAVDTADCTRLDGAAPSEFREDQDSDGQDQEELPANTQKATPTLFSWRRRHSSLDCVCYNGTQPTVADSTALAETHWTEYRRLVLCNRGDLIVRHSDSLPSRLRRDRTVSIITTTTITSTSSRDSTGSGGSGVSVEGNYVSPPVKNPPIMNSAANTDLDLNSCRSCPRFDKRTTTRGDKTTSESEDATNRNRNDFRAKGTNSWSLELPRRNLAKGEASGVLRSIRRPPRLQNPLADDSRSYGSFADVTMTPTMSRQMALLHQKLRERRENSAVFRESKTVKTVSIVIGCFVLCWLPFFVVYITEPFLPVPFEVHPYLKQFVLWLGYFNSVINPFIYAFYNYEFRSTFWQLTIGRVWRPSRRLPRGIAPASPLSIAFRCPPYLRNNSVIALDRFAANR